MTTTTQATTTERPTLPPGAARVIALLVVAAFVVILNETIMSVALPDLMAEFEIGAATAQWITTAFLLTMAVVIPISGYLLQRFPIRGVFITAMTTFSVGTLVAAVAPEFWVLVLGRVVQASGTAIMMPLLITTIMSIVPEARRGAMLGVISIVISVAPAIGPTISGIVLDQLSWRWMFWVVLPIALLALALGATWVRNITETRHLTVDVPSVVLSAVGFAGLVYGLSSLGHSSGSEPLVPVWVPIVVGVVALAVFVWRQLALRDRALLDLRTFASSTFSVSIVLVAVSMFALFGTLVLLPIYLQSSLGLSTLETGLLMLPGGLAMGLLSPIVGAAYDRVGPRPLVPVGAAVASVALWLMSTLDTTTTQGQVVAIHVVLSIGLAVMFTPLMTNALGSVPAHLYSHGSAILGTIQQVAGAAGTALFVTIMTRTSTASVADGATEAVGIADGVGAALLWAGVISTAAIVLTFAVRRAPRSTDVVAAH